MADFRRTFELNMSSQFRLAQLAAPVSGKTGGGCMLAINPTAGENTNMRMASCGAPKAATNQPIRNNGA